MKIDKNLLKNFRTDLTNAVKEIESKYGISISQGGIRFDDNSFKVKLDVVNTDTDSGDSIDPNQAIWENNCFHFGFKESDFDKKVVVDGTSYNICGIKPRSHKYPIILKSNVNGKKYKFSRSSVLNSL